MAVINFDNNNSNNNNDNNYNDNTDHSKEPKKYLLMFGGKVKYSLIFDF